MYATHKMAVIAAIAVGTILPSLVEGAPQPPLPKIRDFDIPTIERLGREIYTQDQLAWKATDIALAQRGGLRVMQRDGAKGWITVSVEGRDVVRMIRPTRGGPEALYDVTFAQGAEPVFSTPENRTLNSEEVAQYSARMLALDNIGQRCAEIYNTVALKDPESDGWLVWALAASTDEDKIITRGHYRFTISADGKSIRQKDALSTTCTQHSKRELQRQVPASAQALSVLQLSHVVSVKPPETFVFTSLSYPYTLFVGTNDGEVWKFDKGAVTGVSDDAPDPDGFSVRMHAAVTEVCSGILTNPNQTPPRFYPTKGTFKIIEAVERNPTFTLNVDPGFEVAGFICARKSIGPLPNDYKVLAGKAELMISDVGEGHPKRMGKLSRTDRIFRFEIIDGEPLTDDLKARIGARLDAFEKAATPAN